MTVQTETSTQAIHDHVPRGVAVAHPALIARAQGTRVWDEAGREYLDFVGGIGVLNVGHNHPRVVAAVREQLGQLTHMCFQVAPYAGYLQLARRLGELVDTGGPNKTLLVSTGAEATENAVKIARAHTGRPAVIAFQGGFHGRTLLGMSLTASSSGYRQNFGPFAPEIYHAPYPDAYHGWPWERAFEALEQLLDTQLSPERVAAVIIEPQLGEGGFVPAPAAYLRELRDLTEQHGILLIADEIQCGFGRTGKMFAYQHASVRPDLVAVAKSLAAGLPLAGVIGRADIMDASAPGGLGGTYAGNPLACAAALAVLDIFEEEKLLERAERQGELLRAGLLDLQKRFPATVGDVRGLGAMLALEFVKGGDPRSPDPELTAAIVERARDLGLLLLKCGPHKNVIRLLPPLNASEEELEEGLELLGQAVLEAVGS